MNFNEAFDQARDEDTLFSAKTEVMPEYSCTKNDVLSGKVTGPKALRVIRKDWQVIKAKKQPMTAEEIAQKKFDELPLTHAPTVEINHDDLTLFAKECEENTHLIYDDLIVFTDALLDMPYFRDYFPNNSKKLAIIQKQIKQYRDKE